ncbi:MAG TPA: hypothetical protein VIZ65_17510 [Cellvibrionaceae bacterium]
MQKIERTVMPENNTATRLYKNLNSYEEGLCKMAIKWQGIFSDLIYMGLNFSDNSHFILVRKTRRPINNKL